MGFGLCVANKMVMHCSPKSSLTLIVLYYTTYSWFHSLGGEEEWKATTTIFSCTTALPILAVLWQIQLGI